MSTCCQNTITTFVNSASTTVPYTGNKPTVSVTYLIDGVWQTLGVAPVVTFTNTNVIVDHGGLSTGVIKFVQ